MKDNFYKSCTIGIIVGIIAAMLFCHVVDKFTISDEEQALININKNIERIADILEIDLAPNTD